MGTFAADDYEIIGARLAELVKQTAADLLRHRSSSLS
jgi:hypothetical protein